MAPNVGQGITETTDNPFSIKQLLRRLGDHNIGAKVRELEVKDLDEAFKLAVRFESYSQLAQQSKT